MPHADQSLGLRDLRIQRRRQDHCGGLTSGRPGTILFGTVLQVMLLIQLYRPGGLPDLPLLNVAIPFQLFHEDPLRILSGQTGITSRYRDMQIAWQNLHLRAQIYFMTRRTVWPAICFTVLKTAKAAPDSLPEALLPQRQELERTTKYL